MWYVIYGVRILGIFPEEVKAKEFLNLLRMENWSEFKHGNALGVVYFPTPVINNLDDLMEGDDHDFCG
jgi:hypothetical protein